MNKDISPALEDWEFSPNEVTARWINGIDGRQKIQMRLDLGIFQMEAEGRPDGRRPRGFPSLLSYYRNLEVTSTPGEMRIDEQACASLQQESLQYYYRYLAFFALKDFSRVLRDTEHNLEIIKLIVRRAENAELAWQFQQFYPELLAVRAKAEAGQFAAEDNFDLARNVLEKTMNEIRTFWEENGEPEDLELSPEEESLLELYEDLSSAKPKTLEQKLRKDLAEAISSENFEKAALLRDELKAMESEPQKAKGG